MTLLHQGIDLEIGANTSEITTAAKLGSWISPGSCGASARQISQPRCCKRSATALMQPHNATARLFAIGPYDLNVVLANAVRSREIVVDLDGCDSS